MIVRAFIYAVLPATDYTAWFFRDTIMTMPRTAGFILSLWVLRGVPGTFWLKIKSLDGAVILLMILTGEAFAISSFTWVLSFSEILAWVGWGTTLAVAFFEETCFRGVLFNSLKVNMTPLKAALVSTLIFTVYHIQAQPIAAWPGIFLIGFSLCAAYHRGAGLIWLVLVHELMDGFYLHVNAAEGRRIDLYIVAYIILALTATYSISRLQKPQEALKDTGS